MNGYNHSVSLDVEKCKGCTTCLKRCPTEAIRIRNGHAVINPARCIDCGQCIITCPHQAKKAVCHKLSDLPADKYKVALPAPALFGQFENLEEIDTVLQGLLDYGFDDVYEVSAAAEIVSDYTRRYFKAHPDKKPIISSACPVIVRLISLKFPYLCENVLPILPPMELAAMKAREKAKKKNPSLRDEDIAIVFISPCPAKASYVNNRGDGEKSHVDYVVSMRDVAFELLSHMSREIPPIPLSHTGMIGIGWASSGGEARAVFNNKYLAADGIENVMRVLEDIDNGVMPDLDFVELNACTGGCVGGSMTVVNPFIAKARLHSLRRYLPVSQNTAEESGEQAVPEKYLESEGPVYRPVSALDSDRAAAISKMAEIERLAETLPGIDCGSCGAPTCFSFATDVVCGQAHIDDCVFLLRAQYNALAERLENKEPKTTETKGETE